MSDTKNKKISLFFHGKRKSVKKKGKRAIAAVLKFVFPKKEKIQLAWP